MQLVRTLMLFQRLDGLIRRKATGSPKKLASLLNLSERQVYRLIEELKDMGLPISYSSQKQCYYYDTEVNVFFEISAGDTEIIKMGKLSH